MICIKFLIFVAFNINLTYLWYSSAEFYYFLTFLSEEFTYRCYHLNKPDLSLYHPSLLSLTLFLPHCFYHFVYLSLLISLFLSLPLSLPSYFTLSATLSSILFHSLCHTLFHSISLSLPLSLPFYFTLFLTLSHVYQRHLQRCRYDTRKDSIGCRLRSRTRLIDSCCRQG